MPQGKRNIRPLEPGEFRQNADGSRSTELSRTVTHPSVNDGRPTNIPTLFVENGKVVEVDTESGAINAALATGLKFPHFGSVREAVSVARSRSDAGGVNYGPIGVRE